MDRRFKSLCKMYSKYSQRADYNLDFYMDEKKIDTWYIRITNMVGENSEFIGGEYLMKFELPQSFPEEKPPRIIPMTPNGIFATTGQDICISVGAYHPENYPQTAKISGFANMVAHSMTGWKGLQFGIGIYNNISVDTIRNYAASSRKYNRDKFPQIISEFESQPNVKYKNSVLKQTWPESFKLKMLECYVRATTAQR